MSTQPLVSSADMAPIQASGQWRSPLDYRTPPYGWGEPGHTLSVLDLVQNHTLDLRIASLLWLAVERHASVISAAVPRLAGKTTLLLAARDFMPPWYDLVYTWGELEDFRFLEETEPGRTYIMVNEISNHTQAYLSGSKALRVLRALERGYAMAATIHADSPEEVMEELMAWTGADDPGLLGYLGLIVTIRATAGPSGPVRRVKGVDVITPPSPGRPSPLITTLSFWNPGGDNFEHATDGEAMGALAGRLGMSPGEVIEALEHRQKLLAGLLEAGQTGTLHVRRAVQEHYRQAYGR